MSRLKGAGQLRAVGVSHANRGDNQAEACGVFLDEFQGVFAITAEDTTSAPAA